MRINRLDERIQDLHVGVRKLHGTLGRWPCVPGWAAVIGPNIEELKRAVSDSQIRAARQSEWALQYQSRSLGAVFGGDVEVSVMGTRHSMRGKL